MTFSRFDDMHVALREVQVKVLSVVFGDLQT